MRKLSTGDDSTLGNWLSLCRTVFGPESDATKFVQKKINESPKGEFEEVVANETQMLHALMHMHVGAKNGV